MGFRTLFICPSALVLLWVPEVFLAGFPGVGHARGEAGGGGWVGGRGTPNDTLLGIKNLKNHTCTLSYGTYLYGWFAVSRNQK